MELSLETLPNFDFGKASVAFQHAIKRAVDDCTERPGSNATRKVVFTVNIVPMVQETGDLSEAQIDFNVQAKLPPWQTSPKPVGVTKQGHLFFSEHAPDNPRQSTIDEAIDE